MDKKAKKMEDFIIKSLILELIINYILIKY